MFMRGCFHGEMSSRQPHLMELTKSTEAQLMIEEYDQGDRGVLVGRYAGLVKLNVTRSKLNIKNLIVCEPRFGYTSVLDLHGI